MTEQTIHLLIHPHDTWYFRDGRNHAGSAQLVAGSKLIPPQRTILGALMALLKETVGSALDKADYQRLFQDDWQKTPPVHLSPVRLKYGSQYYIPASRLVVEQIFEDQQSPEDTFSCLRPPVRGQTFETDLGMIHDLSPEKHYQDYRQRQLWIMQNKPLALKSETLNSTILDPETLFSRETRLGIGLEPEKKNTQDGQIYLTEHVRHTQKFNDQDLCFAVSLTFDKPLVKDMFSASLKEKGAYVRFGAEGRMAFIAEDTERFQLYPTIRDHFEYANGDLFAIHLISPCPASQWPDFVQQIQETFKDCELLNQLTDKPVPIGGWQPAGEIKNGKSGPVNAEYFFESGSCLLFRLTSGKTLQMFFREKFNESSLLTYLPLHPYGLYGYGYYTLTPLK
ncbi:type III-B CRISPR module-associated Cmr3 family protein [Vibrio spartinae]|uniref:CRISPR type III-B/RAMP module-associated protein Cmr3 n=1 Tax=Vibrio spartinae TaxID=1918945 RepID=A0ABX6R3B5_9VIBR|nr:type III-B CRISPR module-associated Cmr3 family protein [Vibrio spartinae]QMV15989.1 CRISPR type III-B/RAMP module-associated protein Cmr3 [Vibrio spartinae]